MQFSSESLKDSGEELMTNEVIVAGVEARGHIALQEARGKLVPQPTPGIALLVT